MPFLAAKPSFPALTRACPAVLPYFPYSRQSKKKFHRGAIAAKVVANLLGIAGVKHVVTVDLHAPQIQGFLQCPVDNLHAEPLIARWIRRNVPRWQEAVVVSKNAGGTRRVTSLADALKLNFGIVTTDRKRGPASVAPSMAASMIAYPLPILETPRNQVRTKSSGPENAIPATDTRSPQDARSAADARGSPRRTNNAHSRADEEAEADGLEYNDQRAHEVTHGRLVQGHIVPDDFPSPATSVAETSVPEEDPMAVSMTMSHSSSFFVSPCHAAGRSGDAGESSDEEDENPKAERTITLVGDVKGRTVLIVDDMIDKPGSWIAAAETVVKRGRADQVYCIATHGVFGGDCLEQMEACDCIDTIVVTNSHPIPQEKARNTSKLVVLDLSNLLAEAIRRNHYGESMSPLFQHLTD